MSQVKSTPKLEMDPILFEVMRNTFSSVADEMSAALRKAAYSTNIKEHVRISLARSSTRNFGL